MTIATIDVEARVKNVSFRWGKLSMEMADGRIVLVPLEWYPRLLDATAVERADWRVMEDSDGRDIIFWEQLDEMIPAVALLSGVPSRESQRSLKRWLATRPASAPGQETAIDNQRRLTKVNLLADEFTRKMKEAGLTLEEMLDGLDDVREELRDKSAQ